MDYGNSMGKRLPDDIYIHIYVYIYIHTSYEFHININSCYLYTTLKF